MPALHLQSRCPVWALATPPLLSSLPAQVATDHIKSHTHVLRTHAMLRWSVMLCNGAFANCNATFHFAWWPKKLQHGGLDVVAAACMLCRVQGRGRGNGDLLRSSCFARWRCALASWRGCWR